MPSVLVVSGLFGNIFQIQTSPLCYIENYSIRLNELAVVTLKTYVRTIFYTPCTENIFCFKVGIYKLFFKIHLHMFPLLLRRLMQGSFLFITMLFVRLPSVNSTKLFPGSKFWSKLINFDFSVITLLVASSQLMN